MNPSFQRAFIVFLLAGLLLISSALPAPGFATPQAGQYSSPPGWVQPQAIGADSRPLPQAMLFVSLSMPEPLLKHYLSVAHQLGVPLVLRGFLHNSLRETATRLYALTKGKNQGGITIDPVAFSRFNVTVVPALVVMAHPLTSESPQSQTPDYDVIAGNLSLRAAFTVIAQQGSKASQVAERYLAQLNASEEADHGAQ